MTMPDVEKAPPPPKKPMKTPEIADPDLDKEAEELRQKSSGVAKLRIDLTDTATPPPDTVGVQS